MTRSSPDQHNRAARELVQDTDDLVRRALGSRDGNFQAYIVYDLQRILAVDMPPRNVVEEAKLSAAINLIKDVDPKGATEMMLALQMVAAHSATVDCFGRAMDPRQLSRAREQELKLGEKLGNFFARHLQALNRHRGKGQQKMTVEYIHFEQGAQAIIGDVDTGAGRTGSRRRRPPAANGTSAESNDPRKPIAGSCTPSAPPVRRRTRQ